MIKANFKAYSTYVVDSLTQWDIDQALQVTGLNLTSAPEVHFSNANSSRAIVRQASMTGGVVTVGIPNSLLQEALRIYAHVGVYEGTTFKVIEQVEIPVKPRKRPEDYQIQDSDEELYSFNRLENKIVNFDAHIASRENPHGLTAEQLGAVAQADKPSGSYQGNGNAASRSIPVGGKGALLVITSDTGTALVSNRGAICHNRTGTAVTGVVSWEVSFDNGILKITTANELLNKADQKYWYKVL